MKLVQIAGYLGSGKTTLILTLVRALSEKGKKVAILVNDVGEVPVDGKVMSEFGLTVKDIGGGCICCQIAGNLIATLNALAATQKPDITIIEPTGIAVPNAINDVAKHTNEETDISFGPTVVLFDTTRVDKLISYETLKRLVTTQLNDADIVALSKMDASSKEDVKTAGEFVSKTNPSAKIIFISTKNGEGVEEIADDIIEITVNA